MIFFKNLFLLLLSTALFANEGVIISQEIISTDSPEELIGNKVDTYESFKIKKLDKIQEHIQSRIESIDRNSSSSEETKVSTPQKKEAIQKTFDEALAQAKKEHKIILLEVYETNCKFCKRMESEVFPKESVIKALEKDFILLKMNGDKQKLPLGITLQMTPMHVFITENKDIDMTFGFLEEKDFLKLLEREKN